MKIAILTSGRLPVPAVQGGAVENLTDFYLTYNEQREVPIEFTVYSIYHKQAETTVVAAGFQHTCFQYIHETTFWYKIRRKVFGILHRKHLYYHYHIAYFFHRALQQIKKKEYDLILLENRPGYAITLGKECPKIPIVLHLHNDLLNQNTPQADKIKKNCALIISISEYIKQQVDTVHLPQSSSSIVCHNGIDLDAFQTSPTYSRESVRQSLQLSADDFVIVYSGRLIEEKGVKELIEAFCEMAKHHSNARLLIIGGTFYGNEMNETDYIRELQKSAEACKKQIVFTGFRPYKEIPSLLRCADLAVIPSTWEEPFALTCAEAMAAGLPIVATRSGGIPEVVDNECALLVEKGDGLPTRLCQAIKELYNQPARRKEMSKHALSRVKMFGKETYAQRILEQLSTLGNRYQS